MILTGKAMEAFEKFYADDVVMQENSEEPRAGKAMNRKFEQEFFASLAEWHDGQLVASAINGDTSFSEWYMDVSFKNGFRYKPPGRGPQMEGRQDRPRAVFLQQRLMDSAVLGRHAQRIESEYLERLHKVRFGLDRGWRPPGLLLKGGTSAERTQALERLKELALNDGFLCSYISLGPDLPLRGTQAICKAILRASQFEPAFYSLTKLTRVAASARELGRNGWIVLIDNVDGFGGSPVDRAEAYRELLRWMGRLAEEQYIGLFCVLAVTEGFEQAVADPSELAAMRTAAAEGLLDPQLLDASRAGIRALEHEILAHELLVLEY